VVVGAALSADVEAPTERVHSAPVTRRGQCLAGRRRKTPSPTLPHWKTSSGLSVARRIPVYSILSKPRMQFRVAILSSVSERAARSVVHTPMRKCGGWRTDRHRRIRRATRAGRAGREGGSLCGWLALCGSLWQWRPGSSVAQATRSRPTVCVGDLPAAERQGFQLSPTAIETRPIH
jgi:hypothetical protein